MNHDRYSMSFTTGSLFHRESVELAALYLELADWALVREKVVAENLLQARTLNTLKRFCSEVISRLRTLSISELQFLVEGDHQEQAYLLWIAACRRYRFIAEFASEVLRERYLTLKSDLSAGDFDAFFNRKSEWNEDLDAIATVTRSKSRQSLFKMLREAYLLTANHQVVVAMFSPRFSSLLRQNGYRDVVYFPTLESGVQGGFL